MTDEEFEQIKAHVLRIVDQTDEAEVNFIIDEYMKDISAFGVLINNATVQGSIAAHKSLCVHLFVMGYKAAKAEEDIDHVQWDELNIDWGES